MAYCIVQVCRQCELIQLNTAVNINFKRSYAVAKSSLQLHLILVVSSGIVLRAYVFLFYTIPLRSSSSLHVLRNSHLKMLKKCFKNNFFYCHHGFIVLFLNAKLINRDHRYYWQCLLSASMLLVNVYTRVVQLDGFPIYCVVQSPQTVELFSTFQLVSCR